MVEAPPPPPAQAARPPELNPWVRIDPPQGKWLLGVDGDGDPPWRRGLRPGRAVAAPTRPYEIQQYEVRWAELEPWLDKHPEKRFPASLLVPVGPGARANYPVAGIPYATAVEFCESLGGDLPDEEQWEYAARGPSRAKLPSTERFDYERNNIYRGPKGALVEVGTKRQDRIARGAGTLHDMLGNAQEWTRSPYVSDQPDRNEPWLTRRDSPFRTVRGLPLTEVLDAQADADTVSLAYRAPVCASSECGKGKPVVHVMSSVVSAERKPSKNHALFVAALTEPAVARLVGACLTDDAQLGLRATVKVAWSYYTNDDGEDVAASASTVALAERAGAANACVRRLVESAVTGKAQPGGEGLPPIKWTGGQEETFAVDLAFAAVREATPASLPGIGFRCVREVAK